MGPSEKNPGWSPTAPRPPRRRESIADHLAGARKRVKLRGQPWTDKLASPAFVADLIKHGIINGPKSIPKKFGSGNAQRFEPRDYRDLLKIVNLKSQGIKHRSSWIVHLWLSGREYPMENLRAALLKEVKSIRKNALDDFAPRGRLSTGVFAKRLNERIRRDGHYDETPQIFAAIATLMMRPQEAGNVTPAGSQTLDFLIGLAPIEGSGLSPELVKFLETIKNGNPIGADMGQRIESFVQQTPTDGILRSVQANAELQKQFTELPARLRGVLDDGRNGNETSALIDTIKKAPSAAFYSARTWFRAIRNGKIEHLLSNDIRDATPSEIDFIETLITVAGTQRNIIRTNPTLAIHIFSTFVHTQLPLELLNIPTVPNVQIFLAELRKSNYRSRS